MILVDGRYSKTKFDCKNENECNCRKINICTYKIECQNKRVMILDKEGSDYIKQISVEKLGVPLNKGDFKNYPDIDKLYLHDLNIGHIDKDLIKGI